MRSLITVLCITIASVACSQSVPPATVPAQHNDVRSALECFDELDSCEVQSAFRDSLITAQQQSIAQRDLLLAEQQHSYSTLSSANNDNKAIIAIRDGELLLERNNFKTMKKAKNKSIVGYSVGGFLLGLGTGLVAGFLK